MSSWSDASPDFKKKFKDWLGDHAYAEFLRYVPYDCSLDVINDWWQWSKRTTLQDINYIYQELFRMVSEYDPVIWSDGVRPSSVCSSSSGVVQSCIQYNSCEDDTSYSQQSDQNSWHIYAQNDSLNTSSLHASSLHDGVVVEVCPFLSDDARDFHYESMQSYSIDFSDSPPPPNSL